MNCEASARCVRRRSSAVAIPVLAAAPFLLAALAGSGPVYDTCSDDTLGVKPVLLPAPPFKGGEALTEVYVPPLRLTKLSSSPNAITDDAAWFRRNNLSMPVWEVPNPFRGTWGKLPKRIPERYGDDILVRAIHFPGAVFLVYGRHFGDGRYLFCLDPSLRFPRYAFDFADYTYSPDYEPGDYDFIAQAVTWAEERDGILYVSHRHRTYAASSRGMNGYITAIDVASGTVVWRTRPLVCNSANFEIRGDVIICGYGFTDEPDYVYQVSRLTGAVLGRVKTKTAVDCLISRSDTLFVRCYDTDYVFRLEPGAGNE